MEAKCPNYAFHPWSEWSPCTSTCDRGTKSRDRGCIDKNAGSFTVENQKCTHGMDKPELFHQEVDCEVTPCARNGGWTPWPKEWEPCNVHCGEGKNMRQNSNMILFSLVIQLKAFKSKGDFVLIQLQWVEEMNVLEKIK